MTNRRISPRMVKSLPVQVEGLASRLLDISSTGARVLVTDQLFIGGCVEVQIHDGFCLRGRAVWQRGQQAGVAFHDLDDAEEQQLAHMLAPSKGRPIGLLLGLLGMALTLNFLVSQAVEYYTLWQVTYGGGPQ